MARTWEPMAKTADKLTDALARKLEAPPAGNVLYRDPERTGLALRVTAAGDRSFVFCYRFRGRERRDTVGGFPEWTTAAAWERAKKWRRDADVGIDPRGEDAGVALFKPLAEQFLAHGRTRRGRELRPATLREYRRALMVYAKPLHGAPVGEIRRLDAASVIGDVATAHGAVTGMRFRAAGSRFYSWLIAREWSSTTRSQAPRATTPPSASGC
jgi:Arm DNA-binding domain